MRKITRGQLRAVTMKLANEQGGCCALCKKPLDFTAKEVTKRPVCDHDHVSGEIRGALCRGCNGAEGKVTNAVARWAGIGLQNQAEIANWLEAMVEYLRKDGSGLIYHSHKTDDDKREIRNAAARKRRAEQKARRTMAQIKRAKE